MSTENSEPAVKKRKIEGAKGDPSEPDASRGKDDNKEQPQGEEEAIDTTTAATNGTCIGSALGEERLSDENNKTSEVPTPKTVKEHEDDKQEEKKESDKPPVVLPAAGAAQEGATTGIDQTTPVDNSNPRPAIDKKEYEDDGEIQSERGTIPPPKKTKEVIATSTAKQSKGEVRIKSAPASSTTTTTIFIPPTTTMLSTDPSTASNSILSFPMKDEQQVPDSLLSTMSQSERKRYREKKRRSEITNAIDQLTKILLKVEPNNLIQQNNLVYSTNTSDFPYRSTSRLGCGNSSGGGGGSQQPLNRTEIINHAVHVLEKLFRENEERKIHIMRLHSVVHGINGSGSGNHQTSQPPATMMMMPQQVSFYSFL